ncbi:MAG: hypothetical protein GY715_21090, partial [Planctomycetes bacterium]|nr:hypothetical protein [Planctomycetota bacterium]
VTVADDDPVPALQVAGGLVDEGDSGSVELELAVTLSNPTVLPVTADFAVAPGTAEAGVDFQAAGGSVSFDPLATAATIAVTVFGDQLDEADETLSVVLSAAVNATLGIAEAVGMIVDDDPLPELQVDDVTVTEGDDGTTEALFTLSLTAPSGREVTVDFTTAAGVGATPASPGEDFVSATGTVSFAPGETSQTISVDVLADDYQEPEETFAVQLSSPVNVSLADAEGTGTIVDDDLPALAASKTDLL